MKDMTDQSETAALPIGTQVSPAKPLPVSPSLVPAMRAAEVPVPVPLVDYRVLYITLLSILLGFAAAVVARVLIYLIEFITRLSFHADNAADNHL